MRRVFWAVIVIALFVGAQPSAVAQGTLDQAIAAKFPLTKATADRSDIVTAGSVMVLKKDGLTMNAIDASVKAQSSYKDGQIRASAATKMSSFGGFMGHGSAGIAHRSFVAGEKLWLIDVQTAPDGVMLQLLSDPISDVRYAASLKFPFPKGQPSSAEQVIAQISQVLNPDLGGDAGAAQPAAAPAPAAEPAPAALPAIAPPPPPPDQAAAPPPTLEKGQTKDQVVAMFGQPVRVVKMGAKEIDYYKDMKVTFSNNKVTNVE